MSAVAPSLREHWLERVALPLGVEHLAGPERVDYGEHELVVVCLAKDAAEHADAFVEHHLALGVRHLVFLDNGSSDDTVSRASRHPQVTVLRTTLPFRGNNVAMRRYLIRRFGLPGRWVLCLDVDELFDYPSSDRLSLPGLLRYLRARGFTAMAASMLDMFSDRPLRAPAPRGASLKEAYPFYDLSAVRKVGYFEDDFHHAASFVRHNTLANPEVGRHLGGVRAGAFDMPNVYLIKHPLLFMDGRVTLSHQHFADRAAVADVTGVLYHYKFVQGFARQVETAVATGAYASGSWEYQRYQRALRARPDLSLRTENARRLEGVDELVSAGFLQVTPAYLAWVEGAASDREGNL